MEVGWWILLIGLCTGLLAGKMIKNGGFGIFGNILIGIAGSIIGGLIFVGLYDLFFWQMQTRVLEYVFVYVGAFVGACVLFRIFSRSKRKKEERRAEEERRRKNLDKIIQENREEITAWGEKRQQKKRARKNAFITEVKAETIVEIKAEEAPIPTTCPHCKNPNTKKLRECEWCGNEI